MHIQLVLLLGTAVASVMGASVQVPRSDGYKPTDLGDGLFTASFGDDGLVNVTRINDIEPEDTPEVSPAGLARRAIPITRFGCYSASRNHGDWERARSQFKNLCNQRVKIPGNGILYAVSGKQVAFGCSWGGSNGCSGREFDDFLDYINRKCGGWKGGWVDMDRWAKQYGMQQRGEAICGKGNRVQWPKL
ncbi:hypothetical protein CKAH01_12427 [Colletotrichum kahawae]|uniref:Secreted protein n=1 Tax=Colletotrichum kahawae TaxID=34407 RepID=A0AAD9YV78_COLKA|nr:hypothetical protein CKAH01_12427 [Colletotrichum kahawae]